jgi:hypothetical protein
MMPGTLALDWSVFMPSCLEGDPGYVDALGASHDTAQVTASSS